MGDYHEFGQTLEIKIKNWWLYWLPNYVSITTGTMPLEVVLQQLLVVF
jgi:hypothetical protein